MKKLLLTFIALWGLHWAMAQEKCASHIYEQQLREQYPNIYRTQEEFENWMAQKVAERRAGISQRSGPYTIPVIVHVIYDNASWQILNNTRNITFEQADSQIRVLNRDFNQTNLDFATVVRSIFHPRAASLNVTFVPATRDPNGNILTEPGVERINGEARFNISRWSGPGGNTDSILKPQTIWDPTRYLNVWVVEFQDSGLFGYATFPPYPSLPGNPGGATSSNDGVVITWRAYGSNVDPDTGTPVSPPYVSGSNILCTGCDRGRTTTHELGHWLGLRHIWGDSNSGCTNANFNDYCQDTPFTTSSNNPQFPCPSPDKCPSTFEAAYSSSSVVDMRENYMDYSADACMGIFTMDQVARMETIMDNSPQRASLTTPANIAAVAPTRPNGLYVTIYPEKTQILEGDGIGFVQVNQAQGVPNATTFTWNFDVDGLGGVSPATFSGATPPAVTFGRAGTYRVRLSISNGTNNAQSNIITINVGLRVPSALQFLDVVNPGPNAKSVDVAKLKWNDNSNSEDNYVIERKKNTEPNSAFAVIATLPANSTTYNDNFANNNAIESGQRYNYRVKAVKGTLEGSVTGSIILERVTALDETPLAREIGLYPNPAQNSFIVDLKGIQVQEARLVLYSSLGQIVSEQTTRSSEATFSVERLPKGMYLLKIYTEKGVAVKRLSVQ